ncbi:MAG: hypothetical protein JXA21_17015 [Anaerolineae bacterium]|nr:hypothetical protein [Anaerolineae bacterium]
MSSDKKSKKIAVLKGLLNNRLPLIGRFLRVQAADLLLEDESAEAVSALLAASTQNPDPVVRQIVDSNRGKLAFLARTQAFARREPPKRVEIRAMPAQPPAPPPPPAQPPSPARPSSPEERLRDVLKTGKTGLRLYNRQWVEAVSAICVDPDPETRANLREFLHTQGGTTAREALVRALIAHDSPPLRALAIEASVAPENLKLRALFFFMTEQWERYEALDFDHSLLRLAYASEVPSIRQHIRDKLRATGRAEVMAVVIGPDFSGSVAKMTTDEVAFVVEALRSSRDWGRLWGLACETTLSWSVQILEILASVGWQPPEPERALFAELQTLSEGDLQLDPAALAGVFPRALLQARLRAPGRINAVAFAPGRPLLGIGTGSRKVVLWNYQTAQPEHVLAGFEHSVGQVVFAKDGTFVCAERAHRVEAPSGIYSWDGQNLRRFGQHLGQVTALDAVSGSTILSTGRDCDIVVWDVAAGQQLARHTMPDWPRAARAVPATNQVMVLESQGVRLLSLALMRCSWARRARSMPTCVAWLPQVRGGLIFAGLRNGEVVYWNQGSSKYPWWGSRLCTHGRAVQGLEILHGQGCILTAGQEGEVRFFDLAKRQLLERVPVAEDGVTTMHISPDEAFMAIGHADGSFSLWDLRGPDVVSLLRTPLASVAPRSLSLLDAFANNFKLEEPVRRAIVCMARLVRHRIRFDIEIEPAVSSIAAGEFDIEIE